MQSRGPPQAKQGPGVSRELLKNKTKRGPWAGETAPWVTALAAKPDDLNSIPSTHVVEEENQSVGLSSGLHVQTVACTHKSKSM